MKMEGPYQRAQLALANLKGAILDVLEDGPEEGLKNVHIGRRLGIYAGHVGHEGHIPRTMLSLMEEEGIVEQDAESDRWRVRSDHE